MTDILDPIVVSNEPFEAEKYLTSIKGQPYLEVKYRLLWFRSEYPFGTVDTELIKHENGFAIFKATVAILDANGNVLRSATGHGYENVDNFESYVEKAETAAIGRALGALGLGTQFTREFDMSDRIVDAPGQRPPQDRAYTQPSRPNAATTNGRAEPPTSPQLGLIERKRDLLHYTDDDIEAICNALGFSLDGLTKRQASTLIDELNKR